MNSIAIQRASSCTRMVDSVGDHLDAPRHLITAAPSQTVADIHRQNHPGYLQSNGKHDVTRSFIMVSRCAVQIP